MSVGTLHCCGPFAGLILRDALTALTLTAVRQCPKVFSSQPAGQGFYYTTCFLNMYSFTLLGKPQASGFATTKFEELRR